MQNILFTDLGKLSKVQFDKIVDLDRNYFSPCWSEKSWAELLEGQAEHYFIGVWVQNENIGGFVLYFIPSGETMAHLLKVLIIPSLRKSGWGHKLLENSFNFLQENRKIDSIFLEVESTNQNALALYGKLAFQDLHLAKNFYGPGKHAVKMIRYLRNRGATN